MLSACKGQTSTIFFWEITAKSSEEESWFGAYILFRAQVCAVGLWWVLAEPYFGTTFTLRRYFTRAPDFSAQSRLEDKYIVDRLLSTLKYQETKTQTKAKTEEITLSTSTLQMINPIPKFDDTDYVEWSRSFNDILQISWPFLSKIVFGLEKSEPILRSREKDPIEGSDYDMGNIDKREPSNTNDIKALDSVNEHLFSILRLVTTGAAQNVLLQFEPKFGRLGDGKQA